MKNLKPEQLALSNFPYGHYSLDYTLDSLERLGAGAIEFYCGFTHYYLGDATYADMKRVGKMLRDHHLTVSDVCPENATYPINIASSNTHTRTRSIDHYICSIQTAAEWNAPYTMIFPGFALFDEDENEVWKRGIESMSYLAKTAESYGVKILLESTINTVTTISSTKLQKKMMDEIKSPALATNIDFLCTALMNETVEEEINIVGPEKIGHVHFRDSYEVKKGDWAPALPGQGQLDMLEWLRSLDNMNYQGYFGCEFFGDHRIMGPDDIMKYFQKWYNEALSK